VATSSNTVFTLRALWPLIPQRNFEVLDQADNPAKPNRVAAGAKAP